MIPVALARKYRPQTFGTLVGQEAIARTVQNAIRSGRIHSAYLFAGTRGVGKTTTARIFARSLNCRQGPTIEPCGECDNCIEIAEGRSVDVQEIDAASHTKVEETRDLLARVAYAPAKGRWRVFIIDEAHMLSKSSFNALLKTLEEPPPHAVFVLATTEPQKILDTVRSRCIEFAFRRIPAARIAESLADILRREGVDFEGAALERIGFEADGSMRDALSLTDQVLGYADGRLDAGAVEAALGLTGRESVVRMLETILRRDAGALSAAWREAWRGGADLRRLALDLLDVLRDLIVARTLGEPGEGFTARLVEVVEGDGQSLADLHRLFDRLHRAVVDLERSPLPDVLLETALLRLATLEPLGRFEDLLAAGATPAAAPAAAPGRSAAGPVGGGSRGSRAAEPASAGAPDAPTATAQPAAAGPAMPVPSAAPVAGSDDGLAAWVAALLADMPALRPALAGRLRLEGERVLVPTAGVTAFARNLLLARLAEAEELLGRLAGRRLSLVFDDKPVSSVVPTRPAAEPADAPVAAAAPARDKRRLLEDERVRWLLEAFPGAEVIDIRWSQ